MKASLIMTSVAPSMLFVLGPVAQDVETGNPSNFLASGTVSRGQHDEAIEPCSLEPEAREFVVELLVGEVGATLRLTRPSTDCS